MLKRHFIFTAFLLLWGITAQAQNCLANFQWAPTSGLANGVQFADSSFWSNNFQVDSVSYSWSFGDGASGTGSNVTHVYNGFGPYNVCLTITLFNPNGVNICSNTSCQTITLSNNPCSGLTAQINIVQNNTVLQAVASGGTPPYSYSWSNGSSVSPILTVSAPGNYCVSITDAVGCSYTACQFFPGNGGGCPIGVNIVPLTSGALQAVVDSSFTPSSLQYNWSNGATGPSLPTAGLTSGVYCVTVTSNNNCSGTACYTYSAGSGCLDTICGYTFYDQDGNGLLDPTDSLLPNVYVVYFGGGQQGTAQSNANGFYSFTVPCNATIQLQTYTQNAFPVITIPIGGGANSGTPGSTIGGYTIPAGGAAGCGYNFGFSNNFITVSGKIYADLNANGLADAGELGIPYQPVQIQSTTGGGQYTAYSNVTGQYVMQLPIDTYQISCTLVGNYSGLTVLPAQHSADGTSAGQSFPNKNFGAQIPAGSVNLSVNLMPHTTVTPGFPAWYSLQVCNVGFTPTGGTADLFFDPNLVFDYASPAPVSVNNTTHTASWTIPVLAPGQCTSIWIDFNTLVSATLGASTFELASVIPTGGADAVMSNNVDTVHQIVVGSWDPNNKLSVQTNYTNPAYQYVSSINADREIEYTINFQNTGTAPAVNVVVLDELSADLDAETFTLISTSHPCVATREGSSVEFKFSNIMLADSTNNEPESHGFITFRIHSVNGLAAGHVISDDADIYFDFNAPVNTGFSLVTQLDPTSVAEGEAGPALQVGPLPMNSYTRLSLLSGGENGFSLRIVDMNGRAVRQVSSSSNTLELQRDGLSTGLYHYELTTRDAQVIRGKLLVQ